ncbi:hypothetical protein Afil01_32970 [Actinorhabdospora filicis]|uniref:Uncharacterized protein n=1 Tax=Actinorhabdospora filicis TaxID=1785913 RepID=A0A9W6SK43_9ACTN|nr:hypothetical protein [Actinorhabdospora filicis]GLZ78490.1 hypothetical protein Afil01_32970 [Actinorhabdospora filicis]
MSAVVPLGTIHYGHGRVPITVHGVRARGPQLAELYLGDRPLGRVGVGGHATPRVWSVRINRCYYDPRVLAELAEALISGLTFPGEE